MRLQGGAEKRDGDDMNVPAVILVGGLGLRLRGSVGEKPKPMAPIRDKPFLEYLITQLRRYEVGEIILAIGYRGDQIRTYFGTGSEWNVSISYSEEHKLLGTGGAVKLVENLLHDEDFLVMNGDSFLDADLRELVEQHTEREALATMALVEVDDPARYGVVEIDEEGEIMSFVEKGQSSRSIFVNGGVYILKKKVVDHIPKGVSSLEKDVFPSLIGKGFYGVPTSSFFIDIGVPSDYRRLEANPNVLLGFAGQGETY